VVLILTSGGFDVAAPGLKTLAGTVDLIATAAMAYYLLGEFLLEGERWALISGLCFALIAGTVVAVVLPLTLAGSSTSSGWYGPALTGAAASFVLTAASILHGTVITRRRRSRLLGAILVATLWTVLAAVAALGSLPGASGPLRITMQLISAALFLLAGIAAWRRTSAGSHPIFLWLGLAMPMQAAAAVEYAARSWRPDGVSAGDVFAFGFSLLLIAGLVVLVSRSICRLRSREADLRAVDALNLIPAIQDTRALAGRIAEVVGPSLDADARVVLPESERGDGLVAQLGQLESRSDSDVVVGYQEETGSGQVTVGAALRASGKRLGLLVASRRGGPGFSREEIVRLRAVAAVAATMIERSLLYDEVAAGAILQERSRLAREIHDGLAQHIAFMKMRVAWMLRGSTIDREHLVDIESVLETALVEARQAITTLRAGGDMSSAADAILEYAQEFGQVSGLNVHIQAADDVPALAARPRAEVLRVVQEALNNVRKHAHADSVRISIDGDHGSMRILVEDNGRGFDVGREPPGHFGLDIMRERVESVGGTLDIHSGDGAGTRVTIQVPAENATV